MYNNCLITVLKECRLTHSNGRQVGDPTYGKHIFDVIFVFPEVSDHLISPVDVHIGQRIVFDGSDVYIRTLKRSQTTNIRRVLRIQWNSKFYCVVFQ